MDCRRAPARARFFAAARLTAAHQTHRYAYRTLPAAAGSYREHQLRSRPRSRRSHCRRPQTARYSPARSHRIARCPAADIRRAGPACCRSIARARPRRAARRRPIPARCRPATAPASTFRTHSAHDAKRRSSRQLEIEIHNDRLFRPRRDDGNGLDLEFADRSWKFCLV